jgi:hypothetical protein
MKMHLQKKCMNNYKKSILKIEKALKKKKLIMLRKYNTYQIAFRHKSRLLIQNLMI